MNWFSWFFNHSTWDLLEEALQGDKDKVTLDYTTETILNPKPMDKAQKLYDTAVACIGIDMSPADIAPDSLACAESLNGVYFKAFGEHLGTSAALTSTKALYESMLKDVRLKQIYTPDLGSIVISPTGYSTKHASHGHTGVAGKFDIMSNDSASGLWRDNYEKSAWVNVFEKTLGFPTYYFLPV